jgi:hypothetical protein
VVDMEHVPELLQPLDAHSTQGPGSFVERRHVKCRA